MRWDRRFWWDGSGGRPTPSRIAASLAEGIVETTNRLRARLDEEGFARAEVKRFQSEECILECLLFEWFLRDIVVSAELGRRAGAIRRGLLGSILSDLERSGLSPAVPVNFHRVQRERFAEYTRALEAGESLQALGALAWVRILGRNEPSDRMTMLLAVRATAELGALRGIRKRYLS